MSGVWTIAWIPAVVVGIGALLFVTDVLDWGLARRRIVRSVRGRETPEEAEALVAEHSEMLLRAHGAGPPKR